MAASCCNLSLTATLLFLFLLHLLSTFGGGLSFSSHRSDPSHSGGLNSLQSLSSSASLGGESSHECGLTGPPGCDKFALDHNSLLLGLLDCSPPHSEVLDSAGIRPESPRETGTIPALTSGDGDPVLSAPLHDRNLPLADDLHSSHPDHSCAFDAHYSDAVGSGVALTKQPDFESVSVSGIGPPSVVMASLIPVLSSGNCDPSNSLTSDDDHSLMLRCTLLAHSDCTISCSTLLSHEDSSSAEHSQSSVANDNRSPTGHGLLSGHCSSPLDHDLLASPLHGNSLPHGNASVAGCNSGTSGGP